MGPISRILVAYDGSEHAEAALEDLKRAGLPASLQTIVVTLANVVPPFPADPGDDDPGTTAVHSAKTNSPVHDRVARAIHSASRIAERAAARLRRDFPGWDVQFEVDCAASASSLVQIGDEDHPDLIVVGAHRHFVAGGRFILGSVSQRVLYDSRCSVRMARCTVKHRGPVRIVIGFNGTPQADAAVEAVLSRAWHEGTEVRLVTANEPVDPGLIDAATEKLRNAHLATAPIFRYGNPVPVLVREAEEWGADSIFLGTNNLHGFQHLVHGSVAAAVAARAECSVEVVRSAAATREVAA
jgi:nucleotide-binding universal stress UspA family protein